MTATSGSSGADPTDSGQTGEKISLWRVLMWTLLFHLAWNFRSIGPIFREGAFVDPDDFLRLHQIRNWMAGHNWHDVSVPRMNPPDGADMHWSRLVDVPIVALTWVIDLFTDPVSAERLAAIIWPTILFVAVIFTLVAICETLFPRVNRLLVLLFGVTCVAAVVEFAPGRIDHHGLQILLYCLTLLGLVRAETVWGHALIGASIALSLVIGLDVLLLLVFILGWLGVEWAIGMDDRGQGLIRTAAAMAVTSLVLFPLSVAPDQWLVPACDANSIVYLAALWMISGSFLVMALCSQATRLASPVATALARLGLGAVLAALSAGLLYGLYPQCTLGPLSGISPELKTQWLDNVVEAKGLISFVKTEKPNWIGMPLYLLLVFGLGLWLLLRRNAHPRLLAILAIIAICLALGFFQVRTYRIGIFAIVPICVIIAQASWEYFSARYPHSRIMAMAATALVCVFLFSPTWLGIGNVITAPFAATPVSNQLQTGKTGEVAKLVTPENSCLTRSEYNFLASLEPGLVMNAIDNGPAMLVFTDHSVVGGNYHRNGEAILDIKDFYSGDEETAWRIVAERGIDYVAFCWFPLPEMLAPRDAAKFGVRLMQGNPPDWLEKLSDEDANMVVYRVRKSS